MKKQIVLFVLLITSSLFAIDVRDQLLIDQFQKHEIIVKKIIACSNSYGIDPYLAVSLAFHESGLRPYAYNINKNKSIDRGIFQLNSKSYPKMQKKQFYNVDINVNSGIQHLFRAIKKGGSIYNGLSIYNSGRVKKISIYAEKILRMKYYYEKKYIEFIKKFELKVLKNMINQKNDDIIIIVNYCRREEILKSI